MGLNNLSGHKDCYWGPFYINIHPTYKLKELCRKIQHLCKQQQNKYIPFIIRYRIMSDMCIFYNNFATQSTKSVT